jgi:hypothetical protein
MPEMNSFLRKAVSLFVVLEEDQKTEAAQTAARSNETSPNIQNTSGPKPTPVIRETDLSKFEKHFSELFDKANLPGPDYFEFWKMMDTLETHIPNEQARMKAVFDSLKIQGLNKGILLQTAERYRNIVIEDKNNFEAVVQQKVQSEVQGRQVKIQQLEKTKTEKEQMIIRLQEEIAAASKQIETLQQEIAEEQNKIESAQSGYIMACSAMISKIEQDIKTFQEVIA